MELPPLSQQLLSQLAQAQNNDGKINPTLSPGARLLATVESSSIVTPQLRARLMQLLQAEAKSPATTQKPDGPHNPNNTQTLKTSDTQLTQLSKPTLEALLKNQPLYAVQVKILGKLLLTFANTPLNQNEKLNLVVRQDGQLQLTRVPKITQQNLLTPETQKPATFNTQGTSTHNTLQSMMRQDSLSAQQVSNALRQYLPVQKGMAENFLNLQNLIANPQIQKTATQSFDLAKLLSQITALVKTLPNINALTQASTLKSAIQNSGAFLESNLTKLGGSKPGTSGNLLPQQQTSRISSTVNAASTQHGNKTATEELNGSKDKDIKAELLQLIKNTAELTKSSPNTQPSKIGNIDKLLQSLFSLKGQTNTTQSANSLQQITAQLSATLQPLLFSLLARISTLQLQRLVQLQQDPALTPFGNMLELPVRLGESIFPLTLHIHQREYEEMEKDHAKDENEDKQQEKRKRWHVFMEFDLDELGMFASDICIEENRVKTTLWVEKTTLWHTTRSHLNQLENTLQESGIEVETLSCLHGKAPSKTMSLQQSLVDIRT